MMSDQPTKKETYPSKKQKLIRQVLKLADGDQTAAGVLLGVSQVSISRYLMRPGNPNKNNPGKTVILLARERLKAKNIKPQG